MHAAAHIFGFDLIVYLNRPFLASYALSSIACLADDERTINRLGVMRWEIPSPLGFYLFPSPSS